VGNGEQVSDDCPDFGGRRRSCPKSQPASRSPPRMPALRCVDGPARAVLWVAARLAAQSLGASAERARGHPSPPASARVFVSSPPGADQKMGFRNPATIARFSPSPHDDFMAKTSSDRARAYRERLKADPERLAAWRNKAAARMRKSRGQRDDVASHVASQEAQEPLHEPTVDDVAPQLPVGDGLARIHREYREECEALGYDVEGNRQAVYERIADKLADPSIRLTPARDDLRGDPEDQGPSKKK
jgi:hypothetical protein